jgi:hypothetical protein
MGQPHLSQGYRHMVTFLMIVLLVICYLVGAGITNGYGSHRWPPKMVRRSDGWGQLYEYNANESPKFWATLLWPFYWVFIWPCIKSKEITFSNMEKHAARQIAQNRIRIGDLHATREQLAASNAELEAAEVELDKAIARGL